MDSNALNQRFSQAIGLSFSAIRLPGQTDIHFCYAATPPKLDVLKYAASDLNFFTFSPYGAGSLAFKLIPDLYMINDEVISGDANLNNVQPEEYAEVSPNKTHTPNAYVEYVNLSISAIQSKKVKKTVAARCENVSLNKQFNVAELFGKLCEHYPDACVYYFSVPGQSAWIGATPEKLLIATPNALTTVALAGTIEANTDSTWSDKERDEQSLTASFIRDLFKQMKLSALKESAIDTIQAGSVKHLFSTFTWKSDSETIRAKFHKILQQLNPTPAVCGLPQQEAASFISKNEGFERRYYSGFIGFQLKQTLSLFVNLRCMEVGTSQALLYAGAGITKDSVAEKEWKETEQKMETLRSLL